MKNNQETESNHLYDSNGNFIEYHDDLEYDRVEYLEKRDRDEWYEFNRRYKWEEHE